MKRKIRRQLDNAKRRIQNRLDRPAAFCPPAPVLGSRAIRYEVADKTRAFAHGGVGTILRLARESGLVAAIDAHLHLLKFHFPYHESDHVLNVALNFLCGGTCLDDIELRRNDEVFLDALGADRIPDPTTAGDFCRRFVGESVLDLLTAIDVARLNVWRRQPPQFFERATIEADGATVGTLGECKRGMDVAYNGVWGYHPLLVTLAETKEVLAIFNRPGNRPSHEGADAYFDDAVALCRRAGFKRIVLRGDTDFTQTHKLDEWNDSGDVRFYFGMDAQPNLKALAEAQAPVAWRKLQRRTRPIKGPPRRRPENVKEAIVVAREYENVKLLSEEVAEFDYRPGKCKRTYRMVAVRKNLSIERGQNVLFEDLRYFFYLTNDGDSPADEVVFESNDRCDQENIIGQLKSAVHALKAPLNGLESNWAYMVMASLAWTLKAWWALWLPEEPGRLQQKHRDEKQAIVKMKFKQFVHAFIALPCQIVRTGRRLAYRILGWNRWLPTFFRQTEALRL